eukprot:9495615-Karenia_brevis.AAC.1
MMMMMMMMMTMTMTIMMMRMMRNSCRPRPWDLGHSVFVPLEAVGNGRELASPATSDLDTALHQWAQLLSLIHI